MNRGNFAVEHQQEAESYPYGTRDLPHLSVDITHDTRMPYGTKHLRVMPEIAHNYGKGIGNCEPEDKLNCCGFREGGGFEDFTRDDLRDIILHKNKVIADLEEHAYGSASWIERLNKGLKVAKEIKGKVDKKPPKESEADFRKRLEDFDKERDAPSEEWGADELNGDGFFDDITEAMGDYQKEKKDAYDKLPEAEKLKLETERKKSIAAKRAELIKEAEQKAIKYLDEDKDKPYYEKSLKLKLGNLTREQYIQNFKDKRAKSFDEAKGGGVVMSKEPPREPPREPRREPQLPVQGQLAQRPQEEQGVPVIGEAVPTQAQRDIIQSALEMANRYTLNLTGWSDRMSADSLNRFFTLFRTYVQQYMPAELTIAVNENAELIKELAKLRPEYRVSFIESILGDIGMSLSRAIRRAQKTPDAVYKQIKRSYGGAAAPKAEPKAPSGVAVAAEALKPVREAIQKGIGDAIYGKSDDPRKQKKGLLGISEEDKEESQKKVMKNIVVPIVKTASALKTNTEDIANMIFNPDKYDDDMKERRIKRIKAEEAKAGIVRDKTNPMIIIRKPRGFWTAETSDPKEEAYNQKRAAWRGADNVFYIRVPNPIFAAKLRPSFKEFSDAGVKLWTGVQQNDPKRSEDVDGTLQSLHDDEFIFIPEDRAKEIYGSLRQFVADKQDEGVAEGFEDLGWTKGELKAFAKIDPRTLKGQELMDWKEEKLLLDRQQTENALEKVKKDIKDEEAKATPDKARLGKMREAKVRVEKREKELILRGQQEFQDMMMFQTAEKAKRDAEYYARLNADAAAQQTQQTEEASDAVKEQAQGSVDLLQQAQVGGGISSSKTNKVAPEPTPPTPPPPTPPSLSAVQYPIRNAIEGEPVGCSEEDNAVILSALKLANKAGKDAVLRNIDAVWRLDDLKRAYIANFSRVIRPTILYEFFGSHQRGQDLLRFMSDVAAGNIAGRPSLDDIIRGVSNEVCLWTLNEIRRTGQNKDAVFDAIKLLIEQESRGRGGGISSSKTNRVAPEPPSEPVSAVQYPIRNAVVGQVVGCSEADTAVILAALKLANKVGKDAIVSAGMRVPIGALKIEYTDNFKAAVRGTYLYEFFQYQTRGQDLVIYMSDVAAGNIVGRPPMNDIIREAANEVCLWTLNEIRRRRDDKDAVFDEIKRNIDRVRRITGNGMTGSAKPTNPALYAKAKAIADKTYSKPSAYKSGFIVKKYKEMGGEYEDEPDGKRPLERWFKEDWKDVGNKEYPVYRPTKRVSKDTPLTPEEIDPENLKLQIKEKQKIKGERNLSAFKKRGGADRDDDGKKDAKKGKKRDRSPSPFLGEAAEEEEEEEELPAGAFFCSVCDRDIQQGTDDWDGRARVDGEDYCGLCAEELFEASDMMPFDEEDEEEEEEEEDDEDDEDAVLRRLLDEFKRNPFTGFGYYGGEGGDDDDDDDESVEDIDIIRIDMGKGRVYLVDAPPKDKKGKLVGLPFSSFKIALSGPLGIGNRRVFDAETEEELGLLRDPIHKKIAMKVYKMEEEWRQANLKKLGVSMDEDDDDDADVEKRGGRYKRRRQTTFDAYFERSHRNPPPPDPTPTPTPSPPRRGPGELPYPLSPLPPVDEPFMCADCRRIIQPGTRDYENRVDRFIEIVCGECWGEPEVEGDGMVGSGAVEYTLQKAGKSLFNPAGDMSKAGRQSFTPDYDAYGATVAEGRKNAFNLSRSMYDQSKAIELPDFKLMRDDTSLRFYRKEDENVILVGIRGTDVKSWTDLYTWAVIGANQDLRMTTRFQDDLAKLVSFQRNYPPSQFYYVATGSSLAGSIADRFLEMGLIEEAITYNPSIERKYVLEEGVLNHRVYLDTDPLFMLMGQYAPNTEIRVNPNKTNFYNPSKEKDYLIASHSIYPIYNPAFEGGGMEGSGKTYTIEEWKAIFDAKLEQKRKAIEAREAKKKQTAKAKRERAKARRDEREKPKEPEEDEPEVEVAEYEMGDEIYLVEEPREGLAFAERRVFDNDGETLGNLTEDDVGKTLVKMVMRREKLGAFADKSPKAKSSSESLPFFESQQRNPAGEFAKAKSPKEIIDDLVEDAVKDIYYKEFPDIMKGNVSKEKLYRDKFLTLPKKKQDELRKKVRERVMSQLK